MYNNEDVGLWVWDGDNGLGFGYDWWFGRWKIDRGDDI